MGEVENEPKKRSKSEAKVADAPMPTHVRVRSRESRLVGFCLRGRALTADGFSLALADLQPEELEQFRAEPLAIVELFTPED